MSTNDSSEMSSSFMDETWIQWFCGLTGNQFFCEIDKSFIEDAFNLFGLKQHLPMDYSRALDTLLDRLGPTEAESEDLSRSAAFLYGLIHARFIITSHGLEIMHRKYSLREFGECPRSLCRGQAVLPMGFTDEPKHGVVKLFCPRCQDVYTCSSSQRHVDGAYFGPTFPNLFLMTYEDLIPTPPTDCFVPRIFGFRIHNPAHANSLMSKNRGERLATSQYSRSAVTINTTQSSNPPMNTTTTSNNNNNTETIKDDDSFIQQPIPKDKDKDKDSPRGQLEGDELASHSSNSSITHSTKNSKNKKGTNNNKKTNNINSSNNNNPIPAPLKFISSSNNNNNSDQDDDDEIDSKKKNLSEYHNYPTSFSLKRKFADNNSMIIVQPPSLSSLSSHPTNTTIANATTTTTATSSSIQPSTRSKRTRQQQQQQHPPT